MATTMSVLFEETPCVNPFSRPATAASIAAGRRTPRQEDLDDLGRGRSRATSSTLRAALSRISPMRFSDSAAFAAISASALAISVASSLSICRLGVGGDLVRLVARLRRARRRRPPRPPRRDASAAPPARCRSRSRRCARPAPCRCAAAPPASGSGRADQRHQQPEDQVGIDADVELRHAGGAVRRPPSARVSAACSRLRAFARHAPVSRRLVDLGSVSLLHRSLRR